MKHFSQIETPVGYGIMLATSCDNILSVGSWTGDVCVSVGMETARFRTYNGGDGSAEEVLASGQRIIHWGQQISGGEWREDAVYYTQEEFLPLPVKTQDPACDNVNEYLYDEQGLLYVERLASEGGKLVIQAIDADHLKVSVVGEHRTESATVSCHDNAFSYLCLSYLAHAMAINNKERAGIRVNFG